jgi:hypothetical protein
MVRDPAGREARRYHWLSESVSGFLDSPHAAIEGRNRGAIINLADARAARNREASLGLARRGPDRTVGVLRRAAARGNLALDLFDPPAEPDEAAPLSHLRMPAHHDLRPGDVDLRKLHATLAAAADRGPADFEDLLLQRGIGARTVAALAFVAEVLHGAPARFADPGRFSLALGGKDGHPFPVPLKVYDETLNVLRAAVGRAKLDRDAGGPSFEAHLATERARSAQWGGRSVK